MQRCMFRSNDSTVHLSIPLRIPTIPITKRAVSSSFIVAFHVNSTCFLGERGAIRMKQRLGASENIPNT